VFGRLIALNMTREFAHYLSLEVLPMTKFKIEKLEERIAPSFCGFGGFSRCGGGWGGGCFHGGGFGGRCGFGGW
jgi:hypothetical protein